MKGQALVYSQRPAHQFDNCPHAPPATPPATVRLANAAAIASPARAWPRSADSSRPRALGKSQRFCHHSSFAPSRAKADAIDATRTTQCT
jgi:hypothetical protein